MRIFVAGSTGVVGRLLLPKLIDAGHDVIGMTRTTEGREFIQSTGARAVVMNAFDGDSMISLFAQVRPEVVIHQLTALSNLDFAGTSRLRVEGTQNLVQAALLVGVRRIVAQSISWAYEPGVGFATEEVALDVSASMPRKRLVESISSLERTVCEIPEHVILRYGAFYGQGTFYHHDGFMAQEVRARNVPATEGVTSFLHVEDAASAALLALEWPKGPVNIVDDEPTHGIEWLPVYADALRAPRPNIQLGYEAWERGASNSKARNEYGWKPMYPTWRTGLPRSLESSLR